MTGMAEKAFMEPEELWENFFSEKIKAEIMVGISPRKSMRWICQRWKKQQSLQKLMHLFKRTRMPTTCLKPAAQRTVSLQVRLNQQSQAPEGNFKEWIEKLELVTPEAPAEATRVKEKR